MSAIRLILLLCLATASVFALTRDEIEGRAKDLPTVKEKDLPPLPNQPVVFPGAIEHKGLVGHIWVQFPFVENPGSFGIDRRGRIFVAETNRFWIGVPDLRGANFLIPGDFQAKTVADRQRLYDKFAANFPDGWFSRLADRIIRLEDRDGNGAADHRTVFSDRFNDPLDGIGFSILPEDDAVYFTCIPNLWKITDTNDDGVADEHQAIVTGFGTRVSFIGHDLHGIVRGPDGRLYFSVGDRGYHVTEPDGTVHSGPGRGAIFRCESDGSDFEVFCTGLRNPQELAFDELGNLFTFDNTGDIGDVARMVYALEGSDSGWYMAHQSAHQYRNALDWQDFHPNRSMWVAEKMFETFTEEQPQWVYPPASHVARGPSGVTWLTGDTLPSDLRNKFLLANYRGPAGNCTTLTVGIEPKGAGYVANHEEVLFKGVGVSDVELGFDGNLYLCDFGGGWSTNTDGAIHIIEATEPKLQANAAKAKAIFAAGVKGTSEQELLTLLRSPDNRIRRMAQFELVDTKSTIALAKLAADTALPVTTRLHGIWGLDQLGRRGEAMPEHLLKLTTDKHPEIRANAARALGSIGAAAARDRLVLMMLHDESPRVQSLAAIALGRVCRPGDGAAIAGLYQLATKIGNTEVVDPVLRHACLSALTHIGTTAAAVDHANAKDRETRLLALLFLRRHQSPELARFLNDPDALIRHEAIRAIYDTAACDGPAGDALAAIGPNCADLTATVQRRIVAANYRRGTAANARMLVQMAAAADLDPSVRKAALIGLRLWDANIVTDPVIGHYRPQVIVDRQLDTLGPAITDELKRFLANDPPAELTALALRLANDTGVKLETATLLTQINNSNLDGDLRVAALDSLMASQPPKAEALLLSLITADDGHLQAAAIRHGFAANLHDILRHARAAIASGPLPAARAAIKGLAAKAPAELVLNWRTRTNGLRPELWLDVYLALQQSSLPAASTLLAEFAATGPFVSHQLTQVGGDVSRGADVFRNQGACLQCHKVRGQPGGGIQGPNLTHVGERLTPEKMVESLINPNAEIAEGYGNSTITLKNGTVITGRIANKDDTTTTVIDIAGKEQQLTTADITTITPPISAMPPMGLSLPLPDLRDLVAYLNSQARNKNKPKPKKPAPKDGH